MAKWVVVAVWLVLLIPASSLAGKLSDVQQNDNSAWLPSNAESTEVVDRAAKFQTADTLPAIVIYDRQEGVTPADIAKARADAQAFTSVTNVVGQPQEPVVSEDGKAIQTVVQVRKDNRVGTVSASSSTR
ncbi:MMPL family transporter [Micromonospora sp. M12]